MRMVPVLILAMLLNLIATGTAMAAMVVDIGPDMITAMDADASAGCHEQAAAPLPADADNCCKSNCTDCLHGPGGVLQSSSFVFNAIPPSIFSALILPRPDSHPELLFRPPIRF